jgi:hypothetical protein
MTEASATLALEVSDVSKQKMARVRNVPRDSTVGELVQGLLDDLRLPQHDAEGRSLSYQALLPREARHLPPSETVGDVLVDGDALTLQPDIDAG